MAKTIVSGNLNTYGNAGQFETDRSTWGFSDSDFIATRSALQKTAGLYGALVVKNTNANSGLLPCNFVPVPEKLYIVKAKVRVPSSAPVAVDSAVLSLKNSLSNLYLIVDQLDYVDKTVLQAKDTWVDIEVSVKGKPYPYFTPSATIKLHVEDAGDININGQIFVDQFEIYEYIETVDPEPTCDIDIDEDATIVTNETAPGANNGSIEMVATGSPTYEFSKDGAIWQLSHQFMGLTTGIYLIRMRRQELTTCNREYPFAVNHGAVAFTFTTVVTHESISGVHDGAIAITVDGSGGPFTFSKDAGATWQGGNLFTDLAPGTYYIAVRDASLNSIVAVVTVNAGTVEVDGIFHSKNPIALSKTATAGWESESNYRLYNEVRVEDVADSGNYNSKLKVELTPDSDGNAIFYLNAAFRDAFTFEPPAHNESEIKRLTDRIKRYKNYTGELTGTDITPGALTASVASLVLWGGIDKFHFPNLNYFSSYISANKKFLTWAPTDKYVDRVQEDYLNFFVYGNFTTLKLQLKVYFSDNTNTTSVVKTKTGTKYTELYQIPTGPANSGANLVDPTKTVIKYELCLLNQNDTVITEVRTYYINTLLHPLRRYFMFIDSLGTFQVLRFNGQEEDKTTFSRDVVQKFLPHNYDPLQGEYAVNTVTRQVSRSISSGFVKDKQAEAWHKYLVDFMASPIIYDVTNGKRYPVVVTGGDHTTADQNYERYIRVEARDAYDNESYTPQDI
jgi:hypothetical protein